MSIFSFYEICLSSCIRFPSYSFSILESTRTKPKGSSILLIFPQDISSKVTAKESIPLYQKYFSLNLMIFQGTFRIASVLKATILPYFLGVLRQASMNCSDQSYQKTSMSLSFSEATSREQQSLQTTLALNCEKQSLIILKTSLPTSSVLPSRYTASEPSLHVCAAVQAANDSDSESTQMKEVFEDRASFCLRQFLMYWDVASSEARSAMTTWQGSQFWLQTELSVLTICWLWALLWELRMTQTIWLDWLVRCSSLRQLRYEMSFYESEALRSAFCSIRWSSRESEPSAYLLMASLVCLKGKERMLRCCSSFRQSYMARKRQKDC